MQAVFAAYRYHMQRPRRSLYRIGIGCRPATHRNNYGMNPRTFARARYSPKIANIGYAIKNNDKRHFAFLVQRRYNILYTLIFN